MYPLGLNTVPQSSIIIQCTIKAKDDFSDIYQSVYFLF